MSTYRELLAQAHARLSEIDRDDDPVAWRMAAMDVEKLEEAIRTTRTWTLGNAVVLHLERGGGHTVDLSTVLEAYLADLSRYPKKEERERDAVIDLLPAPSRP